MLLIDQGDRSCVDHLILERYLKSRREGLDVGNDSGNKFKLIFPKIFHRCWMGCLHNSSSISRHDYDLWSYSVTKFLHAKKQGELAAVEFNLLQMHLISERVERKESIQHQLYEAGSNDDTCY